MPPILIFTRPGLEPVAYTRAFFLHLLYVGLAWLGLRLTPAHLKVRLLIDIDGQKFNYCMAVEQLSTKVGCTCTCKSNDFSTPFSMF